MTVLDNKNTYLLAYGTLRKNQYNFNRIDRLFEKGRGLEYIKTIKLPGYKMYSLGAYPMCIYTGTLSDIIICDIIKMSETALTIIENMEKSAGYTRYVTPIVFKHHSKKHNEQMNIFIFEDMEPNFAEKMSENVISNGDWIDYRSILVN